LIKKCFGYLNKLSEGLPILIDFVKKNWNVKVYLAKISNTEIHIHQYKMKQVQMTGMKVI